MQTQFSQPEAAELAHWAESSLSLADTTILACAVTVPIGLR